MKTLDSQENVRNTVNDSAEIRTTCPPPVPTAINFPSLDHSTHIPNVLAALAEASDLPVCTDFKTVPNGSVVDDDDEGSGPDEQRETTPFEEVLTN